MNENPIIDLMRKEHLNYSDGVGFVQISNFSRVDLLRNRIVDLITVFESGLPRDRQAVLKFSTGRGEIWLNVSGVGYMLPDLLIFRGENQSGNSCLLVQHITQVNLCLESVTRKDDLSSPRRKIGFVSIPGQESGQVE